MAFNLITIICLIFIVARSSFINRSLQTDGFSDPLCAIFDQQTGECQACICRAYFDQSRRCQPINDFCQTWNINTGECTSCYGGYELVNKTCILDEFYSPSDEQSVEIENPNCRTDDGNGTCLSCRPYYILYCGDCQTTGENPFCAKFDEENTCVECDPEYELDVNSVCQRFDDVGNSSCAEFDNCLECNATQCTQCEQGYRQEFVSRKCVLPTQNCTEGCALCSPNQCFACEAGYSAQSWPICINCSFMYARNSEGKCVPILRDCSDFPNCRFCVQGECRTCNEGFELNENQECEAI